MADLSALPSRGGLRVELRNLVKDYELHGRRIPVLTGIDFVVEPGERLGLVGASGSGKSTMLHLLGLLDHPSAGQILYDGELVGSAPEHEVEAFRNQQVGFVFQFHHLLPDFSAAENVMMPLLIAGGTMAGSKDKAMALLERVGLGERLEHLPGELSGGEQQRVALARALVLGPRLLLADEPTGNLDPKTGASIHDLLIELNEELGTTLIVATHNMALAGTMPRRVRLTDGQLIEIAE